MSSYPQHLKDFDYRGLHRYSLTFCTHERRPHFETAFHVDLVEEQILRAATREGFEVTAYCFMPDHVHLLPTGLRDDSDLKGFVARAKQFSGFEFSKRIGTRLWQRYAYERVLRNEESTEDLIRYMIANPIRARLVASVKDYPFWGSSIYSRDELLDFIHWAG